MIEDIKSFDLQYNNMIRCETLSKYIIITTNVNFCHLYTYNLFWEKEMKILNDSFFFFFACSFSADSDVYQCLSQTKKCFGLRNRLSTERTCRHCLCKDVQRKL